MRALLVFETPTERRRVPSSQPPLGICYVASYLESRGIQADIVDCHVQKLDVSAAEYDVAFFGVNVGNYQNSLRTMQALKSENPRLRIVIGGPHTLTRARAYMTHAFVDAVIIGEAELTAYELMVQKPHAVRGLLTRTVAGKTVYTGDRPLNLDLDSLPFPALHKVPLEKYRIAYGRHNITSNITTSRGCPGRCIFCSHSPVWRARSAHNVVAEIEWQVQELGVEDIAFSDDSFTQDRKRVVEICERLKERGIGVRWQLRNGIRADRVDYELLELMRDAGLWLVTVSPESGSAESLRKIRKGISLEQFRDAVSWCNDLGILTIACFTIGYPWETPEHLEQTLSFARDLPASFIQFSRVVPIEGTPLYGMLNSDKMDVSTEKSFYSGGMQHSDLRMPEAEVHEFIRRAYRTTLFSPRRLRRLMKQIPAREIRRLAMFALSSESI